ncbi:hypothetical protein [Nocardia sp. NPDC004604]|uniref:hypothetical protein n=1 Tax=Nocardia sp. NPDC004604 TaxID=3157013 RepID=UPI0033A8E9AC
MNNSATTMAPDMSVTVTIARPWALKTAVAVATITAVLHTFVQATPTIGALMAGNATAEAQQGLRMMWHGMSAIAWSYPVVLLLLPRKPAPVTRPALGYIALLNGTQALLYAAAGVWVDGASGLRSLPQWTLHAAVAGLALLARPPRSAEESQPPVRPRPGRRVLLWVATLVGALNAILHTALATFQGWPAALLTSDTLSSPKQALYAMWLFSCVLFISVPAVVVWSLRAPAAAGRFVVRYAAVLAAALMVSWACAMAFGLGHDLTPVGPFSLGLLVALTALSAPPRPRPNIRTSSDDSAPPTPPEPANVPQR